MDRAPSVRWGPVLIALFLGAVAGGQTEDYLGPTTLVASGDGRTLYVANADARQIMWVGLPGGEVTRRVVVPLEPTGMVLEPTGAKLLVTCAAPASSVVVLDARTGQLEATIPAGHTAMGPAITPDGKRLYVCNRFDNDVSVIDLATGTEQARVKAVREPVAAVVTPDGETVLVANHLPNARTDSVYMTEVAAAVTVIDSRTNETSLVSLLNGSHSLRDICLSAGGRFAYVTHILSNFELAPTQLDQGWANINALSVIDVEKRRLVNTVGLDEMFSGAANPWGVAATADGEWICVAHSGSHQLSVVDASVVLGTLLHVYIAPLAGAIPEDPRLGHDLRRRIDLPGFGPRGVAVAGSKAYVAQYFSDSVAEVDLAPGAGPPRTIRLGPEPEWTVRRRGEFLFHDATICYQHWQSCASCHPDGRTDALNWDLMNDGLGNFKNTKSMILAHLTPPAMAEGVRPSASAAVRAGIEHVLFAVRPEEEAAAIDEYLCSLRPIPSPYRVRGKLSRAAQRGKALFQSRRVGCFKCHPPPLYTDLQTHDVGTQSPYEFADRFDTPTLVEVWRTAPYLHDGRYTTVKELIVEGKHGRQRGRIEELSEGEIDDLVEFVLSL